MRRSGLLKSGIALLLGLATSSFYTPDYKRAQLPTTSRPTTLPSIDALTAEIEREVSKMDPWAAEILESDLTKKDSTRTGLTYLETEERNAAGIVGEFGADAKYNAELNRIEFTLPNGQVPNNAAVMQHELWHAFGEGVYGVSLSKDYHGPERRELERLLNERMSAHSDWTGTLDKLVDYAKAIFSMQILQGKYGIAVNEASAIVNQSNNRVQLKIDRDKLSDLEKKDLEEAWKKHGTAIREASDNYSEAIKFGETVTSGSLDNMLKMMGEYNELGKKLETISPEEIIRHALDYAKIVSDIVYNIDVREREKRKDNYLGEPERFIPVYTPGRGALASTLSTMNLNSNIKKLKDIREDTGEFMARMVQSLYSLYMGPANPDLFPLTKADLQFLGMFYYKGKPMFEEGIKRYERALGLMERGFTPDEIQVMSDCDPSLTAFDNGWRIKRNYIPVIKEQKN